MPNVPFSEFLGSALRRGPLLPLALGVWLGCAWPAPAPAWLLLPALLALRRRQLWSSIAELILGALLGTLLSLIQPNVQCPPAGATGQWVGRVLEVSPEEDGRTSLLVDIEGKRFESSALRCQALVSTGRRTPEVLEGDLVWTPDIALEPPVHLVNPGIGDSAQPLLDRGVERVASAADGAGVLTVEQATGWTRWRAVLRAKAGALFARLPDSDGKEVARALGLGQRSRMAIATAAAFRDSGLRHLLTLGLLYLSAWLGLAFLLFARAWGRFESGALALPARRAAAALALPIPFFYGVIGTGLSTQRAVILGVALVAGLMLGRPRTSALHLLSLGLIGLLIQAPDHARDPELIWSLCAAIGIWIFAAPWLHRRPQAGLRGVLSHLGTVLAVGAGAFLATAPLQLASSQRVSLLAVPLGIVGLGLALPAALLSQLAVVFSSIRLLKLALWPAALLAKLAVETAFAGQLLCAARPVALCGGLLAAIAAVCLSRRLWRPAFASACVSAAVLSSSAFLPRSSGLRITFLSVGHGDAAVIETAHGHTILIDAGGSIVGGFDPGREIVVPFLQSRGIRKLDVAILSHPHPDHANGLPAVFRDFDVAEFWHSGEPCPLQACEALKPLERRTRELSLGSAPFQREIDGIVFTLLSPRLPLGYDPALGPNDNSLVFALRYGEFRALLTGDIEATAEARLVDAQTDLGADLLKAPHHGSDTSSTPAFVERVKPRVVIFSVGPRNRFNFPRGSVVERYHAAGATTLRTDFDGAVSVETDGRTFSVIPTVPRGSE